MSPFNIIVVVVLLILAMVGFCWWAVVRARKAFQQGLQQGAQAHAIELTRLQSELRHLGEQRQLESQQKRELENEREHWRAEANSQGTERARLAGRLEQLDALQTELDNAQQQQEAWSARCAQSEARLAEVSARLDEQSRAHREQLQIMEMAETRLRETFQNLSGQIFDERNRQFGEQSREQLGGLLTPLKEQLKVFEERIGNTWSSDQRERGMLAKELESLRALNQQMTMEAVNLTRALKGDTRVQGAWGEMLLARVLESSGLIEGRDYDLQSSFKNEAGERARPDAIIHLPEGRDVILDAKISLTAYARMVEADDATEREAHLKEHLNSIRLHIDGLSRRAYENLPGVNTIDFVLMFVPIEAAFIDAVRADEALYRYAQERNIILVGPSTLLATLRTIAYLWKLESRSRNAEEIAKIAGGLYDQFVALDAEFAAVGEQIERALRTHENASKRIGTGKGNLIRRVEQLRKLGADAKKQLPAHKLSDELDEAVELPIATQAPVRTMEADEFNEVEAPGGKRVQ